MSDGPQNQELLIAREGPVTRLTLNRPEKANALSASLVEALLLAVERAHGDGTWLLAFQGAGKHFCAGFDFTEYEASSDGELATRFLRIETLLQKIYHAPYATLALAQGKNFGAGVDLLTACELRIAAPDAMFRLPGPLFGVVLGTSRLAARIGEQKARDILISANPFPAEEGLQMGLLTQTAPVSAWADILLERAAIASRVDYATASALRRLTLGDSRAVDMSELAASVSVPGLKERIRRYRGEART